MIADCMEIFNDHLCIIIGDIYEYHPYTMLILYFCSLYILRSPTPGVGNISDNINMDTCPILALSL